ncbi:MAG: nitroreductase family protein [Deltaproteobacteria bacterium]|nr:nitroreductase family protein [Deltaproteobacteria bacterium]
MAEKENKKTPDVQNWNSVEKVIFERRSVRKYRDKQVPENLIRRVLEAGRFAPSAGNCQPWKFIVLRDKEMINEMERDVIRLCKVFKFLMDWRRPGLIGKIAWLNAQVSIRLMPNKLHPIPFGAISLIADGKLGVFHGAPTIIFILKDRRGVGNPDLDCGICGQNMVLAAYSLGLSTCWIGFAILLAYGPKWKRRLGIGFPYELVEGICIGYPVGNPNGIIPRETHEIDWYEHGEKKTMF